MRKLLFAAVLFGCTSFGFAKDNVQKNEVETVTKNATKQVLKTPQINALKDVLKKAICTDVHAFYKEVVLPNGDTDVVYTGSMVITYECDNAQVSLYIWY